MPVEESEFESSARARLGTTLRGKYRLDRVIGFGGMAVVYKATHRNQAEFAVKMLHPELSIREEIRSRFVREGYAANSVKHPGVVLVVDDDVAEDGAAFLVMELLDGVGCEALWEESGGILPVLPAVSVVHQLLDVLAAAHAKGIVHRDIKPANLFVSREGRLKVLDFGIARVRDAAAGNATATGMLLGTPAFMPPEQALAKSSEIDAQTDVWAAGATLFTLLSGALVHEGDNGPQIMIKAATQHARSLATVAPHVPAPIVAVVDRSLAFDKPARWPDAASMREALHAACHEATGEAPSPSALVKLVEAASEQADAEKHVALASTAHQSPAQAPAQSQPNVTLPMANAPSTEPRVVAQAAEPSLKGLGVITTASPLSQEAVQPAVPVARRWPFIIPAALVGIVGIVGIGLVEGPKLVKGFGASPPTSESAPMPTAASAPPPAATSAPEPAASPMESSSSTPTASASPSASASTEPRHVAAGEPARASPHVGVTPARSAPVAAAPAVASPPRPAAPAAEPKAKPTSEPVLPAKVGEAQLK